MGGRVKYFGGKRGWTREVPAHECTDDRESRVIDSVATGCLFREYTWTLLFISFKHCQISSHLQDATEKGEERTWSYRRARFVNPAALKTISS